MEPIALLRRGLQTWAFCLAIASLQSFFAPARPYGPLLVYSLAIGTGCWLTVEAGRRLLARADDPGGWPHGPRGLLLWTLGVAAGFAGGTALGDAWFGRSSWSTAGDLQRSLVITVVAGAAIMYFFHSRGRSAYLAAAARDAARTAAEARLQLLEVQLEPHMLFNTLANLRVLIATDPPRAEAMLDHLIAYLRATLGGSRAAWHPLADECARLGDYLALMQVRMGPRLAYGFDIPADLRGVPVPALLLQPLVENSIRHGLEPQVAGGRIDIRARRDGAGASARLVLEVQDTGVGLPPPTTPVSTPAATTNGFGTAQVRDRLAAAFGAAGTLYLIAHPAGGTCAIVRFPLQNSPPAPAPSPRPA